jgi:hypothetical protein
MKTKLQSYLMLMQVVRVFTTVLQRVKVDLQKTVHKCMIGLSWLRKRIIINVRAFLDQLSSHQHSTCSASAIVSWVVVVIII